MTNYWTVTCVPRKEALPRPSQQGIQHVGRNTWVELAQELTLRLERTPAKDALRIEFASMALAARAYHGLRHHWPNGTVTMRKIGPVIYLYKRTS